MGNKSFYDTSTIYGNSGINVIKNNPNNKKPPTTNKNDSTSNASSNTSSPINKSSKSISAVNEVKVIPEYEKLRQDFAQANQQFVITQKDCNVSQKQLAFLGELERILLDNTDNKTFIQYLMPNPTNIRDLTKEEIVWTNSKGEERKNKLIDIVNDANNMTPEDQELFLKAYRENPEKTKHPIVKKFEQATTIVQFTLMGVGMCIGFIGLLAAFGAITLMPQITLAFSIIGAIGLAVGVAFLVSKVYGTIKDYRRSARNQELKPKIYEQKTTSHDKSKDLQNKTNERMKEVNEILDKKTKFIKNNDIKKPENNVKKSMDK